MKNQIFFVIFLITIAAIGCSKEKTKPKPPILTHLQQLNVNFKGDWLCTSDTDYYYGADSSVVYHATGVRTNYVFNGIDSLYLTGSAGPNVYSTYKLHTEGEFDYLALSGDYTNGLTYKIAVPPGKYFTLSRTIIPTYPLVVTAPDRNEYVYYRLVQISTYKKVTGF